MTGPGLRTLAMLSLGCSGAALQLPLRVRTPSRRLALHPKTLGP